MKLSDLNTNQSAILTDIQGDSHTKRRLRSFGLDIGSKVQITQKSPTKANIKISSAHGLIALRSEEAKLIECELIP